jgi:hypothetical protein
MGAGILRLKPWYLAGRVLAFMHSGSKQCRLKAEENFVRLNLLTKLVLKSVSLAYVTPRKSEKQLNISQENIVLY